MQVSPPDGTLVVTFVTHTLHIHPSQLLPAKEIPRFGALNRGVGFRICIPEVQCLGSERSKQGEQMREAGSGQRILILEYLEPRASS